MQQLKGYTAPPQAPLFHYRYLSVYSLVKISFSMMDEMMKEVC